MQDPESRDIHPMSSSSDTPPVFIFQIEYPVGTIFCIPGLSALDALEKLQESGIEPFMIRRAGVFMPMEDLS